MATVETADGLRLEANSSGEGAAVLLIAGTNMDQGQWAPQALPLAERYHVITYDGRDVGASDRATEPYDTALLADDAAAVLDAFDVDRAHLVGVSLGGCVAQQLALRHPDRVASVCTASTWARTDAHLEAQFRFWIELAEVGGWRMVFRLMAFMAFSNDTLAQLGDTVYVMGDAMEANFELEAFRRQVLADLGHGLDDDELARISAPFLSLAGGEDLLVPRRHAEHLAATLPHGSFGVLEGVSHSVMFDHPERFNAALDDWLAARA